MAAELLIQGGIVLSMLPGAVPRQMDVLIDGDRIAAVGAMTSPLPDKAGRTVINVDGCLVMPGLINAHTHTPMTLMRSTSENVGFPSPDRAPTLPPNHDWRAHLTPDDLYWSSRLAMAEMIRTGTTTFVDMFHDMDRVAQAVVDTGLRGALGWEILTFRNDPKEWLPYDEATARRTFEECGRFAADWHGKGDGRVIALIAPHETGTCHEPWLTRAAQLAEQMGLGITIHVAECQWEVDICQEKYGLTPVGVLQQSGILERRVIGAHNLILTDEDIKILSTANFTAAACLGGYIKLAIPVTPVPQLLRAGVNVALGTDGAVTNNNLNMWEEIHLNATLHGFIARDASLVPGDMALRMATVAGAKALGLEKELGTIEPGKKADLIVLDLRQPHLYPLEGALVANLVQSASGFEVRDVLVDGRVLMRNSEIIAFDESEILRQAEARVRRLRAEVGLPRQYQWP
jgi:5-methylthioadenosine/S-adenosylhomocysteine deaminase